MVLSRLPALQLLIGPKMKLSPPLSESAEVIYGRAGQRRPLPAGDRRASRARHHGADRVAYLHDSPEGENPRSEAAAHYRRSFKHLTVTMLGGGIRPATTRRQPASVR